MSALIQLEEAYTTAWAAAHTVKPSRAWRNHADRFVYRCKAAGFFTSLDRVGIFFGETSQGSLIDIRQPSKAWTLANAPTHLAARGFTPNGTTGYIASGELPDASPNGYSLNSAMAYVAVNQQNDAAGFKYALGLDTANRLAISMRSNAGNETSCQMNSSSTETLQANPGTHVGRRALSRTAASVIAGFFNGAKTLSGTGTSTAVPNSGPTTVTVGRNGATYSANQFPFAAYGQGLSDANMALFDTYVLELLTAVGAN